MRVLYILYEYTVLADILRSFSSQKGPPWPTLVYLQHPAIFFHRRLMQETMSRFRKSIFSAFDVTNGYNGKLPVLIATLH